MKITLFADGATRGNPGPSSAGVLLLNEKGEELGEISKFLGTATNNQAEYAAVVFGLEKALKLKATEVEIFLDSKLIVEQVSGRWKIKEVQLKKAVEKVHALLQKFSDWKIQHVPREKNSKADALANRVLDLRGFKKKPAPFRRWQ
ncbi:MAG: ribonuclease HI family protein [Patescibacteria group bacterium]